MKLTSGLLFTFLFSVLGTGNLIGQNYYPDLSENIDNIWFVAYDDLKFQYNEGREQENVQLGTNLPSIQFPEESEWNSYSDQARAFWLLNVERIDRGLNPFEAYDSRVAEVAANFAQFMADNDTSGHYCDEKTPKIRLKENSEIAACFKKSWENLGYAVSTRDEEYMKWHFYMAVYRWIYKDGGSSWGHRRICFVDNMTEEAGEAGKEGIVGFGSLITQNYQGPFSKSYDVAGLAVMNMFQSCSSWEFEGNVHVGNNSVEDIELTLYPTLANDLVHLIDPQNLNWNGEIIDLSGRTIRSFQVGDNPIEVSDLPVGNYFLRVFDQEKGYVKTLRFTKV